jgi:endonuclease/exonuclease/phosphatase family metal-dependent hydrolase
MDYPNIPTMDEVISGAFAIHQRQPWSRHYIRVVTWNIERGLQFSAILEFLRAAEADLILLQEVDLNARRTQYRDVASELARSLSLNYVFGKEFQELSEGPNASPAYHGVATLSPWPLLNERIIRFQHQSNFWKPRWYVPKVELFQRRLGGRLALRVKVQICSRNFVTYNMHLESRGKNTLRLQQLREVLEDTRQNTESPMVILGGDFNLDAGNGDAAKLLHNAGFHDAVKLPELPTTDTRLPLKRERCIDWIYISGDVRSEGQVHNTVRASDHHPVSITVAIS